MATSAESERTSWIAWASAWAIFSSAILVRLVDVVLDPLPGLDAEGVGLALGLVDDLLGLGFGLARLPLVLGEKRLRLLAELARLVELGPDRRRRACRAPR